PKLGNRSQPLIAATSSILQLLPVPKDVMMEELNLPSNRGSRMFQERQKRVERYTLENAQTELHVKNWWSAPLIKCVAVFGEFINSQNPNFVPSGPSRGHSSPANHPRATGRKGKPGFLHPCSKEGLLFLLGYSGPLKGVPHEKFNTTVIPKSYCSPWSEALGNNEELLNILNTQLPELPQTLQPASYRCFNSKRVIPVMSFEAVESQNLPSIAPDRMCQRPNFNRAPRGWGADYSPESNEL
uniref:Myozenin 3a n=1 Tax=Seriola lalandi dorsalis TaxID=1841481 RepID=A0A3B4WKC8_SERLL